MLVKGNP